MTAERTAMPIPPCIETGKCPSGYVQPASIEENQARNRRLQAICGADYPLLSEYVDVVNMPEKDRCGIAISGGLVNGPGSEAVVNLMNEVVAKRQAEEPADTRTRISTTSIGRKQ